MNVHKEEKGHWDGDLLTFAEIGQTFTNLIKTIQDDRVISIEAGFGHGKTFFRKAWAKHLRAQGEVVVEIDALETDQTGDPVITLIGALMAVKPGVEKDFFEKTKKKGVKLAGLAARSVARAVLRSGAEEMIGAVRDMAEAQVGDANIAKDAIEDLTGQMSRLAGQMIESQLAAEKVRKELPAQLDELLEAITRDAGTNRIVIIIDELDRCHPDYALALLEAMKVVFKRKGFVFCLMVNTDYLERIAAHRFGQMQEGETYLEKFVDLRLKLAATRETIGEATKALAMNLPLEVPFGNDPAFSVEAAATLAGEIARQTDLTFRQIKRVLDRVELALRCHREKPIDCPLLVLLAFASVYDVPSRRRLASDTLLPRSQLTPGKADKLLRMNDQHWGMDEDRRREYERLEFIKAHCRELSTLPDDRYVLEPLAAGNTYRDGAKVILGLGKYYIPSHQRMLDFVEGIMA